MAAKPGADLTLFTAQIDLQEEQFVGIGMLFGFDDSGNAQVELGEVVVLNHAGCVGHGEGSLAGAARNPFRPGSVDDARRLSITLDT